MIPHTLIIIISFEKLNKYQEIEVSFSKMCHLKATALTAVIGALGMISKGANIYTKL